MVYYIKALQSYTFFLIVLFKFHIQADCGQDKDFAIADWISEVYRTNKLVMK